MNYEFPDIDYRNDIYYIVMRLSLYIRLNKYKLSEDSINDMISLTIDLLDMLELYKNDKYYDY